MAVKIKKQKTKIKSTYKQVGEYFAPDSQRGVRLGTMISGDAVTVVFNPLVKNNEGKIFTVSDKFGGMTRFSLDCNKTKKFRAMFDEAVEEAKNRLKKKKSTK